LGTTPHVEELDEEHDIVTENVYEGNEDFQVVFSTEVKAETIADPGTTVYYRAFTYDNIHYNWGEERSFTLPTLQLSTSYLSLEAGWTQTVDIRWGSGSYLIDITVSSGENVVTASVYENTLSINALNAGEATIKVTDTKTGQTETIEVTVTAGGDITAYTSCPDGNHPHMIDLGLPSGTLWACCNVGANAPEEYGDYFAWGETKPKEVYSWSTYIHCDGSSDTCHDLGSDIAGTDYDAATTNWGAPWKMPTIEQFEELKSNCDSEWTQQNGVYGRKFTRPNDGTIFLPAAGDRHDSDLRNAGSYGFYWSSTLDKSYPYIAERHHFYFGNLYTSFCYRFYGYSVRPVQ
jgi:hypothetical protein